MTPQVQTQDNPSIRGVEVARAAWGSLLLLAPSLPARLLSGPPPYPSWERPILRVLGLRHVAQSAVLAADPAPVLTEIGAAMDGLHAATALGYAASGRTRRRTGLLDAAVAGSFGVATLLWPEPAAQAVVDEEPKSEGRLTRWAVAVAAGAGWWLLWRSRRDKSAARKRSKRRLRPGTLRYRVPDHQDPAVLSANLRIAGYPTDSDWEGGANHLTIFCDDMAEDRSIVRSLLQNSTASSLTGSDIIHVDVVFEDEQPLSRA